MAEKPLKLFPNCPVFCQRIFTLPELFQLICDDGNAPGHRSGGNCILCLKRSCPNFKIFLYVKRKCLISDRSLAQALPGLNSSQFSVLRLLLYLFVHVDRRFTRMEANWFLFQVRRYGVSNDQKKILNHDIQEKPNADLLLEQVEDQDLDDLLKLLNLASKVDGEVSASEKKFLNEVRAAVKLRLLNPKDVVTQFVQDHIQRQENWELLFNLGRALSRPVPLFWRLRMWW